MGVSPMSCIEVKGFNALYQAMDMPDNIPIWNDLMT
jgi:phosphoribosylcarboxyaminoimidazole (NCAIR) mutase